MKIGKLQVSLPWWRPSKRTLLLLGRECAALSEAHQRAVDAINLVEEPVIEPQMFLPLVNR